MALQTDSPVVGQALFVSGAVSVRSAGGVSQVIKPNSPIHLNDRIDTGGDGAVSIILSDGENNQLDLGNMSSVILDDDVAGGSLPELVDVAVEVGLMADLLQNWESFETVVPLDVVASEDDVDDDMEDVASADSIPGLDGASKTVAASSEAGEDGVGSIDDDLDMNNLIPPPEDAS